MSSTSTSHLGLIMYSNEPNKKMPFEVILCNRITRHPNKFKILKGIILVLVLLLCKNKTSVSSPSDRLGLGFTIVWFSMEDGKIKVARSHYISRPKNKQTFGSTNAQYDSCKHLFSPAISTICSLKMTAAWPARAVHGALALICDQSFPSVDDQTSFLRSLGSGSNKFMEKGFELRKDACI